MHRKCCKMGFLLEWNLSLSNYLRCRQRVQRKKESEQKESDAPFLRLAHSKPTKGKTWLDQSQELGLHQGTWCALGTWWLQLPSSLPRPGLAGSWSHEPNPGTPMWDKHLTTKWNACCHSIQFSMNTTAILFHTFWGTTYKILQLVLFLTSILLTRTWRLKEAAWLTTGHKFVQKKSTTYGKEHCTNDIKNAYQCKNPQVLLCINWSTGSRPKS